jgi:histone arginine demethylase JMJD6
MPAAYAVYRHAEKRLSTYQETNANVSSGYFFPPISLDFSLIQEHRRKAMEKWGYNYAMNGIDRRHNLSLEEFYEVYDGKWPVLITDCVPNWPAFKKWTVDFFTKKYGEEIVSMAATSTGRLENIETFALPLSLFLGHVGDSSPRTWTYLQDELFLPYRTTLANDIGTCEYLKEDFFQLFPKDIRPWWSFLLWGTAYSRSTLHIDPYNWTGTNAVLYGAKRWKMIPPGQDHLLYVKPNQSSNFPLNCPKYNSPTDTYDQKSLHAYPLSQEARAIEFVQQPGEILIIPTGWWHQAFNEVPTLAVSGQLMNRNNYRIAMEEIFKKNSLPRGPYPADILQWEPEEQVKYLLKDLPEDVLRKGRESTKFIQSQLDEAASKRKRRQDSRARGKQEL